VSVTGTLSFVLFWSIWTSYFIEFEAKTPRFRSNSSSPLPDMVNCDSPLAGACVVR